MDYLYLQIDAAQAALEKERRSRLDLSDRVARHEVDAKGRSKGSGRTGGGTKGKGKGKARRKKDPEVVRLEGEVAQLEAAKQAQSLRLRKELAAVTAKADKMAKRRSELASKVDKLERRARLSSVA